MPGQRKIDIEIRVLYSGSTKGLNLAPELFTLQESYERQLRQKPLSHHRNQSNKTNRKAATKMGMARRSLTLYTLLDDRDFEKLELEERKKKETDLIYEIDRLGIKVHKRR